MSYQLQNIASNLLGSIEWQDINTGFCTCPGEDLHSGANGKRDCRVLLEGAPFVDCFHTSCLGVREDISKRLRSEIGKASWRDSVSSKLTEQTPEQRARIAKAKQAERLKARASQSLDAILKAFPVTQADMFHDSPSPLYDDGSNDWRLLLALFRPDDVVWIGDKFTSATEKSSEAQQALAARSFRTVERWLKCSVAPEKFTCPATFKPGAISRSNDNVVTRRYLVLESDLLRHDEMCSVFCWARQFMRLRAVVNTAGKSLHGWFEFPSGTALEQLRAILPNLGRDISDKKTPPTFDPALFKMSQPVRLPGALRDGKYQHLVWLDLEGAR